VASLAFLYIPPPHAAIVLNCPGDHQLAVFGRPLVRPATLFEIEKHTAALEVRHFYPIGGVGDREATVELSICMAVKRRRLWLYCLPVQMRALSRGIRGDGKEECMASRSG